MSHPVSEYGYKPIERHKRCNLHKHKSCNVVQNRFETSIDSNCIDR